MFRSRICFVIVILAAMVCTLHAQNTIYLTGIIRDQAPNTMNNAECGGNAGTANSGKGFTGTDFQMPLGSYQNDESGLVGNECNKTAGWYPPKCAAIGADQTPVYAYKGQSPGKNILSPQSFYNWFHDSNQTITLNYNITLTLTQQQNGPSVYAYINDDFYPIDGKGWKDHCNDASSPPKQHNYGFCLEAHTRFGYHGGEVFNFVGDDDVWVFIDGRLVIDLGSLHPKRTKSVALDDIQGLTAGQNYRFDFFYCERHTTESNMELTTSLEFYCSYYDWCGICEGTGISCCNATVISTYCDDHDACTTDSCSVTVSPILNGDKGCVHKQIPCQPDNACQTAVCDKVNGCVKTTLNCTDPDPCTIDSCDINTGCKHVHCNGSECPTGFGCVPQPPLTCIDGNPCTSDIIILNATGSPVNCSNPLNQTACDDDDVCTNDYCDSSASTLKTACSHTNVTCTPPTICQTALGCNRFNGCQYEPIVCPGAEDPCKIASCDPIAGCILVAKVCVVSDHDCFKGVCEPTSGNCTQQRVGNWATATHNGVFCALIYDSTAKKAAIGAGAAAGIAIGAAAALGIFGYGGKKGYDYIKLMRNQKFADVQNNPLYEQTNGKADNPLYRYSTTDTARA